MPYLGEAFVFKKKKKNKLQDNHTQSRRTRKGRKNKSIYKVLRTFCESLRHSKAEVKLKYLNSTLGQLP